MLGKKVGKSSIPQIIPHTIFEDSTGIIARTIWNVLTVYEKKGCIENETRNGGKTRACDDRCALATYLEQETTCTTIKLI